MKHPLDSSRERLKRAYENIRNLNSEVNVLLAPFPHVEFRGNNPVFSDADREAFEILRKHVLGGEAIPRFSVLAGEIVHHLRCAFDHLIWQLSTPEARKKFGHEIEFPVAPSPPECVWRVCDHKVKHSSYCRKVKGVATLTALARIEELQPYKRPANLPLLYIHKLDVVAKHRELNVVIPNMGMKLQGRGSQPMLTVKDSASGGFRIIGPAGPPKVDVYGELSAQVAFAEFSEREGEPLVEFLDKLARFSSDSIESFADEFS
jgi:hypothetical protein